MKLRCARTELNSAFQLAAGVASPRAVKPVLQNVLIDANDGIELLATDLEISLRVPVTGATVETAGRTLLPAQRVGGILRESQDEFLDLELAEEVLTISGSSSTFRVPCANPEEFPQIGSFPEKATVTLPCGDLQDMVKKTVFAAAHDTTRYSLNGVLLEVRTDKMKMVATDGRRLALVWRKSPAGTDQCAEVIIPTKALSLLGRVLTEEDETVDLCIEESQFFVRAKGATLIARLVEGSFPAYEDVIPKNCECKARVDAAGLLSAVRQASLMTSEDEPAIRMSFTAKELTVSGQSAEGGEATVKVPLEYDGKDLDISFNPVFVEDMLKVADVEEVRIEFREGRSQALFHPGANYLYVVMPVVKDEI